MNSLTNEQIKELISQNFINNQTQIFDVKDIKFWNSLNFEGKGKREINILRKIINPYFTDKKDLLLFEGENLLSYKTGMYILEGLIEHLQIKDYELNYIPNFCLEMIRLTYSEKERMQIIKMLSKCKFSKIYKYLKHNYHFDSYEKAKFLAKEKLVENNYFNNLTMIASEKYDMNCTIHVSTKNADDLKFFENNLDNYKKEIEFSGFFEVSVDYFTYYLNDNLTDAIYLIHLVVENINKEKKYSFVEIKYPEQAQNNNNRLLVLSEMDYVSLLNFKIDLIKYLDFALNQFNIPQIEKPNTQESKSYASIPEEVINDFNFAYKKYVEYKKLNDVLEQKNNDKRIKKI